MARFVTTATLMIVLTGAALANPMPKLPELPPLPTNYTTVGGFEGNYAGVLGSATLNGNTLAGLAVVGGRLVPVGDALIGAEILGLINTDRNTSLSFELRGGFELDNGVAIFTHAGLGYTTSTGSFLGVGGSIEFSLSDFTSLRTQYRYSHDLSGETGQHAILTGVMIRF